MPENKQFGFIAGPEAGSPDIFFHESETDGQFSRMHAGDKVTYEIGEGRDGRTAAKSVRLVA